MFQESTSSDGILRSETYLTKNYEPDEPVGREAEINKIADAVRPLARRKSPDNLLVYGSAGIGKTTCVRYVFDRLESEAGVKGIYINAWQYNSRSSLLTELLIQLGYPTPRKGVPVDELLSKLQEWMDKNRGVAVAIDEFDQLQEKNEIIYDLQMLDQEAENSLGIIMVSNQPPSKVELDPRSQSRLNCQTLQFNPYNAPQLEQILSKRVEQAFKPGTVPDEVLEEIAETVAENSGDCREALEKLLRAGRKADSNGDSELGSGVLSS